jgi:hypothetical protein
MITIGHPLSGVFIGDTVTNTVLPRFFSRSSVTLSVTCGDKRGRSVTNRGPRTRNFTGGNQDNDD